ncbi:MAG TPA: hypothetical protein VH300_14725 [Thermoleophilaceae bacterium]|nr:hypothetical protein [Thermoleophilaceae bacterium]
MTYVQCPTCGLIAFSVARWSSIDYCARCGTKLPMGRRAVPPTTLHPHGRMQPQSHPRDVDDAGTSAERLRAAEGANLRSPSSS